jgi:hypothetical protein
VPKHPVTMAIRAMRRRALLAVLAIAAAPGCMPPSGGANALLHPQRHVTDKHPARTFEPFKWQGTGVTLVGWWFHAAPETARGTLVYLQGVSDNRGSSVGIADHFVPSRSNLDDAFHLAEADGNFRVDDVSRSSLRPGLGCPCSSSTATMTKRRRNHTRCASSPPFTNRSAS